MDNRGEERMPQTVAMPAPTGWPMIAACGITFVFAGLLTHGLVSILGAVLLVMGLVGWFRAVLPHEAHEPVLIQGRARRATVPGLEMRHLQVGEQNHRARLPLEIYPYSAGIWGGWVAGIAMAVLAVLYGIIGHHSMWYPVNLLAAAGSAEIATMDYDQLRTFSETGLILALVIHVSCSTLVGLLYSVLLPIFPRRPMLVGGIIAPLLWSGLLYTAQGIINPTLNARIDWPWFVAFQVLFGVIAGFVVARHERVATLQFLPFAVRAGIESPDSLVERNEEEQK
jgi:hypothetical protein